MNRQEFISQTSEESGLSKADVTRALDAGIEVIKRALKNGEQVSLTGFGIFEVRQRAARTGRNPRTGDSIEIAASATPVFKASKAFKDAIN